MEEDVYPNDGQYFLPTEPAEQKADRKREKAEAAQSSKVLNELIARYDQRILFYKSVDSIPKEVRADAEKFMVLVNANALVADILSDEREHLMGLLEK